MCGRYALDKETHEEIVEYVDAGGRPEDWWQGGWNIKPTETVPVLLETKKGGEESLRRLEPARWSLVPSWSKTLALKFPTFDARSEDIMSKATWKGQVKSKRAIVPASGYYEWTTDPETKK